MRRLAWTIWILAWAAACGTPSERDAEALRREQLLREPVRISEGELVAQVLSLGPASVSDSAVRASDRAWHWPAQQGPTALRSLAATLVDAYGQQAPENRRANVQPLADSAFLYCEPLDSAGPQGELFIGFSVISRREAATAVHLAKAASQD